MQIINYNCRYICVCQYKFVTICLVLFSECWKLHILQTSIFKTFQREHSPQTPNADASLAHICLTLFPITLNTYGTDCTVHVYCMYHVLFECRKNLSHFNFQNNYTVYYDTGKKMVVLTGTTEIDGVSHFAKRIQDYNTVW